ncbi:MAG TPA: DUF1330 domain-containing protein [Stellaceae bacterium]|jgi:uncharacterized protein (DUF1330 family)|nr:DUF1330 domain-containing protein [Stellaceae bacterium]
MKANYRLAFALTVGVVLGAAVIQGLHAQATAPTYVVVDISAVSDPEGFKAVPAMATPAWVAGFGGKYIVRSENITAVDGAPPKRFIVIEFDTLEHAKAWRASDITAKIDAIRAKTATSREFIVGGM